VKRFTIIFECGCSFTIWAEGSQLAEADHKCLDHESDDPGWQSFEGKKISHISVERRR